MHQRCSHRDDPYVQPIYTALLNQLTETAILHNAILTTNKSSALAEMGDRGHNKHGPKREGGCAPFTVEGELGPHLKQCGLG